MAKGGVGSFATEKDRVLYSKEDLSRKGSVDRPILELVDCINSNDHYYTTSSCSGRIIVFCESIDRTKKKGCKWLLTSHETISLGQLSALCVSNLVECEGYVYLKFEALILHVACKEMCYAQQLLQSSISSGFRNSGISIGKKGRIIVAVRSTHSLQNLVAYDKHLPVTDEYLEHIVRIANDKMTENLQRIARLLEALKQQKQSPLNEPEDKKVNCFNPKDLQVKLRQNHNEVELDVEPECFVDLFDC